jgi:hypothetical protein
LTSTAPSTVSVTPNSGSGAGQTFTFVFADPKGYSAIVSAQILFNSTATFANGCYLYFNRAATTVYLTNDAEPPGNRRSPSDRAARCKTASAPSTRSPPTC